ncbi:GGDEF domain-containing protein [Streptomyces agglomeratus]|uniref:GGDEF domain-containing protein n=1 Tax=Streptomyces agglomeratus TaxID=285458 RepID=UPI000855065C|nr:GGDEF domain-containing protein [Streptomyces agglomeratus]OEJ36224.1 diguanylate cyclase [Streptomyces agglomeratus]OEJ52612.1 diguanylate cyclase [Streptomyces agglomeratus]
MSQTLTALAAALPLAAGWSLDALRLHRRIEGARRDPLTGLWTRDAFEERARKSLTQGQQRAVYVLDLNGFKEINDTIGHAAGDAVIRATGQRLGRWTEGHAGVAGRLGGDEFAAITPACGIHHLCSALRDLLDRLEQPVEFDGQPIDVSASIGAARYWRTGTADLSALLRAADEQMYQAKQTGGGWGIAPKLEPAPAFRTVNGRRDGRPGTSGGTAAA